MSIAPAVAAASFLSAAIIVPIARELALRKGIVDNPNERSSHTNPRPRVGGVGIVLGVLAGLSVSWLASPELSLESTLLLGILLAVSGLGLLDDLVKLSPAQRMPLYLLASFALGFWCFRVQTLALPFLPPIAFGAGAAIVFTSLMIAWYANLFNFMDGIDGIAGGAAVVTNLSLAFVFMEHENAELGQLSLSLAGASAGFLLYNYSPSNVFMGDGGSIFLGTACGALTVAAVQFGYLSLVAGVLLMFPFVFDATFTLLRRALHREKIWRAHRSHIYQQLCDLHANHRSVAIWYTMAAVACAYLGLIYDRISALAQLATIAGLVLAGVTLARMVAVRRSQGTTTPRSLASPAPSSANPCEE